jgi:hypothetical protein
MQGQKRIEFFAGAHGGTALLRRRQMAVTGADTRLARPCERQCRWGLRVCHNAPRRSQRGSRVQSVASKAD